MPVRSACCLFWLLVPSVRCLQFHILRILLSPPYYLYMFELCHILQPLVFSRNCLLPILSLGLPSRYSKPVSFQREFPFFDFSRSHDFVSFHLGLCLQPGFLPPSPPHC